MTGLLRAGGDCFAFERLPRPERPERNPMIAGGNAGPADTSEKPQLPARQVAIPGPARPQPAFRRYPLRSAHLGFVDPLALECLHLADPDVAEPHRVAVILQADRALLAVRLVAWRPVVWGIPFQLEMVLDQDPVVEHRNVGRAGELAVGESRRGPDDVVGLPRTGLREAFTSGGCCL